MNSSGKTAETTSLKHYFSPKTVIGCFVFRHSVRAAALWALVFGGYFASKAIGLVDLYPTAAARQKIVESFSNNVGIELILGRAPHAATTAAYTAWNTGSVMILIGSIWALLLATKYFRGEEEKGRQELLLSGQTTARGAAGNIFAGLGLSLVVFYLILAGLLTAIGKTHGVDVGPGGAAFFTLCVVLGMSIFLLVGAFLSQLMPTRSRAASVTAVIFGICFLLRAIGDITSLHWLLNISPLGWVEKLQPLSASQPLWLIPIIALDLTLFGLSIYFANKRDLNESVFADKTTAKPHLKHLNSPLGLAVRLSRVNSIGWLSGITLAALLYGVITKSTAGVFSQSASFEKVVNRLAQQSVAANSLEFLGIVFLLQMLLLMGYAASSVTAIRRDEADGYVDNFLVRPISRLQWLSGRVALSLSVIVLAGLLTTVGVWVGIASSHLAIPFQTLFEASVNALVPAILTVGIGTLTFGFRPRLTTFMAYAVLVWSFLIEMLSSGLQLNHWILDTSLLHQVVLAPTISPKWSVDISIVGISVALFLLGTLAFDQRDIETE